MLLDNRKVAQQRCCFDLSLKKPVSRGVLEQQLFNRAKVRDLRDKLSIAAALPQIIQLRLL
jgi:hypothetical protein